MLIDELGQKIENQFHEGVQKINREFQSFFSLMFGGGNASITIVKTEARKRKDTDLEFDPDVEIVDGESEKVSIEILRAMSQYEDSEKFNSELVAEILTNKALRQKIKVNKVSMWIKDKEEKEKLQADRKRLREL